MKAYLITTGLLFAAMAVVHVARAVAEWPRDHAGMMFLIHMSALVLLPGALAWWAFVVWRKVSAIDSEIRG
ncbi:MAG TPA: hypothetical protein VH370_15825 [Humisphaera sp.]|nr:hypothetical protein [Humisphaera sp.]